MLKKKVPKTFPTLCHLEPEHSLQPQEVFISLEWGRLPHSADTNSTLCSLILGLLYEMAVRWGLKANLGLWVCPMNQ